MSSAVLPRTLHEPLRRLGSGLLAPVRFASVTGHFRSALHGKAYDAAGDVLPWYTYPMIDLLAQKDFKERSVLEFGAGHSTLWWARRAARVISFEENQAWHARMAPLLPQNTQLYCLRNLRDKAAITAHGKFDIVVIDGFWRERATQLALLMVAARGAIILDNSECHWGWGDSFPILDLFRREGFARVDFHGFVPGIAHRQCTSIAFKGETFLFDGTENPAQLDPV
jgi:hypothetical protein